MLTYILTEIPSPITCRIIRRVNRFTVLVSLNGNLSYAYLNNTGRLEAFIVEGRLAYLFENPIKRGSNYRLFAVEDGNLAALVDTNLQMKLFEKALIMGLIKQFKDFKIVRRNVPLRSSLIDYLLEYSGKMSYLEVKSAVMRIDGSTASYPDCPSIRGRRHIEDLMSASSEGLDCTILFIAALPYINRFKPNGIVDPKLVDLLRLAIKSGVSIKAISMYYDPSDSSVYLDNPELNVEV